MQQTPRTAHTAHRLAAREPRLTVSLTENPKLSLRTDTISRSGDICHAANACGGCGSCYTSNCVTVRPASTGLTRFLEHGPVAGWSR